MNAEPKQLVAPVALSSTAKQVYQAPANKSVVITKLVFANTADDIVAVTLHLVPQGGSATTGNMIIPKRNLNNLESWAAYQAEGLVMKQGDSLYASTDSAGAGSVNVVATGVEIF